MNLKLKVYIYYTNNTYNICIHQKMLMGHRYKCILSLKMVILKERKQEEINIQ